MKVATSSEQELCDLPNVDVALHHTMRWVGGTLSLATRKDKGLKLLSQNGYGPLGQEPPETSEAAMPAGFKLSVWTNNHV